MQILSSYFKDTGLPHAKAPCTLLFLGSPLRAKPRKPLVAMVFDIPFRVLASRPIVEVCQILQKFVTHVIHCLTAKHVY